MIDAAMIITFVLGIVVGVVFMLVLYVSAEKPLNAGDFIITYDDPTKDLIRIDLGQDLPEIEASKSISFNVIINKNDQDNQTVVDEESSSAVG